MWTFDAQGLVLALSSGVTLGAPRDHILCWWESIGSQLHARPTALSLLTIPAVLGVLLCSKHWNRGSSQQSVHISPCGQPAGHGAEHQREKVPPTLGPCSNGPGGNGVSWIQQPL